MSSLMVLPKSINKAVSPNGNKLYGRYCAMNSVQCKKRSLNREGIQGQLHRK
jgi:hypothetical protein